MRIHRSAMALTICAAAIGAGLPLAAGTASAATATCSTTPWTSAPVRLDYRDLWSYSYRVSWCTEGTKIVWAQPETTHTEHDATCTWVGNMEEWQRPEQDASTWSTSMVGEYSCTAANGAGTYAVNPWATVNVHADGTYTVVDQGIEE